MSGFITASEINRYISFQMKNDNNLRGVFIKGEISNFTNHLKSGHFYFTIKDEECSIKAVMFKNFASQVRFAPENGMSVIVMANVQVYERDGIYQLYVTDMQPDGLGAIYMQFEQLKEKLSKEGLFDEQYKQPLPYMPQTIGVVTAKTGAALQDIINVLGRRYPMGEIVVFPVFVQGDFAVSSICKAIEVANTTDCDVLIVGRGGGSIEDLAVFNSEDIARTAFASRIPIISAVGHEPDFTILDFVADYRAPTPSAAAEIVAPDIQELLKKIVHLEDKLHDAFYTGILRKEKLLEDYINKLLPLSVKNRVVSNEEKLKNITERLDTSIKNYYNVKIGELGQRVKLLDSLSPLKVLMRGYAAVYSNGKVIKSSKELKKDDKISVKFNDGEITAIVIDN